MSQKKISSFILSALLLLFAPAMTTAQNYQLVWSDEFDGPQVNLSEWEYEVNGNGGGNNELQYYTSRSQNSAIVDGKFVLTAAKESYLGKAYTSARLHTKKSWQYGKIEGRIKLPYGKGIWPAFWMLGSNINTVGWPKCGEIDIMEMIGGTTTSTGGDGRTFGTAHWANTDGSHAQYGLSYALASGKLYDAFHTFSIVWDAKQIIWYIDNIQFCVINTQPSGLNAFRAPHFIIINLAVGGNWPGSPDGTTVFPQKMEIDYIRVYQVATTGVPERSAAIERYELLQNYPNPFNPTTVVRYSLPEKSRVTISIVNALGQVIEQIADGAADAGYYEHPFNASGLSSGVYFYTIEAVSEQNPNNVFRDTKKMVLMR